MKLFTITLLAITMFTLSTQAQRPGGRGQRTTEGTAATRTGATGQNLSPTQQQNIQKLQADLNAIKQGSQVTAEQKQALKNELMAMADGATKPDPALVQQIANDFADAMSDGSTDNKEKRNSPTTSTK